MTEEEVKSYEILYKKIMFVDKYRFLKPHWIKFHNYIKKLEKENEKKDDVIDEMSGMINTHNFDDICKQFGKYKNCSNYIKEGLCKKCIKEYFYKKVEEQE